MVMSLDLCGCIMNVHWLRALELGPLWAWYRKEKRGTERQKRIN